MSAAGVICLWLLNQSSKSQPHPNIDTSRVFQSLSVLVVEMETGVLIETDDPNYKLLVDASKTIGCLLSRLILGRVTPPQSLSGHGLAQGGAVVARSPASAALLETQESTAASGWNAWDGHTLHDFESDFWLNLAEHPFLAGAGGGNDL